MEIAQDTVSMGLAACFPRSVFKIQRANTSQCAAEPRDGLGLVGLPVS